MSTTNQTGLRAAIVTGASRGIGAAIAARLAADGVAVIVNYAHAHAQAADVVAQITEADGRALAVQADLAAPNAMKVLFDAAEKSYGGADILVNNAGVMSLAPIAEADDAMFERILSTNLGGVFRGLREGANRLRDGGRIVSLSSSVVGFYQPTYGLYAATKAAVEAMTHILAKELGPRKITVNAVAPGPVATDLFLDGKDSAQVNALAKTIPLGRLGQPEDIASVVSFLASPGSQWVNGQVIRANGGAL